MATKNTDLITPANARRAHRRRLPAIMKKINARLRDGHRFFMAGDSDSFDFPEGMYPMVVEKFTAAIPQGWIVKSNPENGTITVRLSGEPTRDF